MSAVTIKIELPPESQALIKNFQGLPTEIPQAIKRGMDRALGVVRGRLQRDRLAGHGPFPPSEHRLGEVSRSLQQSVHEEPAVIRGNEVTGAIGSNVTNRGVNYALVHEFGVRFTTKKGKNVEMPERAPFRTGITENADYIAGEISSEIDKSLDNLNK